MTVSSELFLSIFFVRFDSDWLDPFFVKLCWKWGGGGTLAVNLVEQRAMMVPVLYCWSKQTNIRTSQMKPTSKVSLAFDFIEPKENYNSGSIVHRGVFLLC